MFQISAIAYIDYKTTYDDDPYRTPASIDYMNISSAESSDDKDCCSCSNDHQAPSYDDEEAEFQILFEDFLQNNVYLKK